MAVADSDLVFYLSASMPEDDASTSGGAINTAARLLDQQLGSNDTVDVVSDGADTRDVTITGRDAGGAIVSETLTLNGATPVTGSQTFERILKIVLSATDASRTVTVSDGDSGDGTLHTFNPDEDTARALFYDAASESSQTQRYEKVFARNTNGTDTLTNAEVQNTTDPEGVMDIALAATKDDAVSVANRETEPDAGDLVGEWTAENTPISVPSGQLAAGEAIGIWFRMTLSADQAAGKSDVDPQVSGTSA